MEKLGGGKENKEKLEKGEKIFNIEKLGGAKENKDKIGRGR